jgi:hypothetical protein
MEQNFLIRLLHWLSRRFDRYKFLRAFGQAPDQVVVREPGERFLSAPRPIALFATEHWQFAWLADSAYGKSRVKGITKAESGRSKEDPEKALARAGWTRWANDGFLRDELRKRFDTYHLRVEVWQRKSPSAVAVTFGGTVFQNRMD